MDISGRDSLQNHGNPNINRTYFAYTYALAWKRFVSFFLDMLIIGFLTYLLYNIVKMFSFFVGNLEWSDFITRNWYYFAGTIFMLMNFTYFTIMPSISFSSTFGQLTMGLKQIDKTGNRISYARACAKLLASIISKILYIGYFLIYFNPYNQTFHEMITNTFLVER